jgi:hypothetical protein
MEVTMKIKKLRSYGLMAIVILMVLMFIIPQASAAYSVKQIFVRIAGTAGETVTTGELVAIKDSDGEWYKADAATATIRPAIGIVGSKTGGDGETIEVIIQGVLTGWSSLAEGDPGYLSETAGEVTQSTPSYSQQVALALSTTDYYFDFKNYFDTSSLTALGVLTGATPIVLEGATVDAHDTTIAVTDPTGTRTIMVPDYSGATPLVVAQGYTQTSQAGAGTSDVTGSSLTLEDGWFTEGKTLRYTAGGNVTAGNAAVSVKLYFEDAAVMTLSTTDGAAGDWIAEFILVGVDATNQRIIGKLGAEAGAELICDYAADTTDTGAAGTIPIKLQITSGDAGDTITAEYVVVEFWQKTD